MTLRSILTAGMAGHISAFQAKCAAAIVGAPGAPVAGYMLSIEAANQWLSCAIKAVGLIGGLASIWWMWRLNRLEKQHKVATMCADCIAGFPPPGGCPQVADLRPKRCPQRTGIVLPQKDART